MSNALRPYQIEQVAAVEAQHRAGVRATLVVAATGTGKTTSSAELAQREVARGGRVLFLAHRRELLEQAGARFSSVGIRVGYERGKLRGGDALAVCASVQTLKGARLAEYGAGAFTLIIIDEAHHAAAKNYREIVAHFTRAKVLGVTATPHRADGIALANVFESVAHTYGIEQAVTDKYLCPIRGVQVTVAGMDLSKVRQRRQMVNGSRDQPGETIDLLAPAGQARVAPEGDRRYSVDLHPGDLGDAVVDPAAVEGVVRPLLELAAHRRTVVFAVDRRHAAALVDSLNAKSDTGQIARMVDGTMRTSVREGTLADYAAGKFQFLVNVMLLTEGWDCPAVECVALARPTQSLVFYSQAVGRALRLHASKTEALLLDFVGAGCQFSLVQPEDALAGALIGPVERIGPPATPRDRGMVADMAKAIVDADLVKIMEGLTRPDAPVPAGPPRVSWVTRVFDVICPTGEDVADLGRLLSGKPMSAPKPRAAKAPKPAKPASGATSPKPPKPPRRTFAQWFWGDK